MELLINATIGYEALSFMDKYLGIIKKMHQNDAEMTVFRSRKCVFCYWVMPFGLENVVGTYQRAMTIIFKEMLMDTVGCYVDSLVVKSR